MVAAPMESDNADAADASVFDTFTAGAAEAGDPGNPSNDDDEFDPFHIGEAAEPKSPVKKPQGEQKPDKKTENKMNSSASVASNMSTALPPRLVVKFKVHEEIASCFKPTSEQEGASDVFVQGTVLAQVTSSDALKNAPFVLIAAGTSGAKVEIVPNETFTKMYTTKGQKAKVNVIKIPKSTIGFVTAAKYKITETIDHMPLLLERKVTRMKQKIQIAVQIRSKLTNPDDMFEFSIALALADTVVGDSVVVTSGQGEWDRLKRTITWKKDHLQKGESFMVTARAVLTEEAGELPDDELSFPVMLRCRSDDQISTAQFQAVEASGYPATVSSSTVARTYRIIHRLK